MQLKTVSDIGEREVLTPPRVLTVVWSSVWLSLALLFHVPVGVLGPENTKFWSMFIVIESWGKVW